MPGAGQCPAGCQDSGMLGARQGSALTGVGIVPHPTFTHFTLMPKDGSPTPVFLAEKSMRQSDPGQIDGTDLAALSSLSVA